MKRKSLFLIFATLLLAFALACGGGSTTSSITGGGDSNSPPNKPYNPTPSNAQTGCPINQSLSWISAGDPNDIPILNPSDITYFNIYFGDNSNPGFVGTATNTFYTPPNALIPGKTYYWRVEAVDKKSAKTSSESWSFTVFGYSNTKPPTTSNNPPFVKALYPVPDTENQPYNKLPLFWFGGDPDPDDFIKYSVYFDTGKITGEKMADTALKAQGLFASRYDFKNLLSNKNYSWQIEAIDSNDNRRRTPILHFKTANTTSTTNSAPYPPFNPKPENGDGGQPNEIMLSWNVEDPDERPLIKYDTTYVYDTATGLVIADSTKIYADTTVIYDTLSCDLYLSQVSGDVDSKAVSARVVENNPSTNYFDSLEVEKMYFWKVVVKDNHGKTTDGPTWNFFTGNWNTVTVGNPPFMPSDPHPFNGDQNAPTYLSLNWFGGDPDGDYVTYTLKGDTNIDNLKNDNPEFMVTDLPSTNFFIPDQLESDRWYYWQITAKDSNNNITKGDIWSFKTGFGGGANNDMPPWVGNPNPWDWANFQPPWITLTWDGGDPNPEDRVSYEVYFGEANLPGAPFWQTETDQRSWTPGYKLTPGQRYVWRIAAKSKKTYGGFGGSSEGPTWSFTVGAGFEQNNPPFVPNNPNPWNQQNNAPTSLSLSWNGGDPDFDIVDYDIYLGTNPAPSHADFRGTSYGNNTSYWINNLEQGKPYYWYVKARDNKGGEAKSQIWMFKTTSYATGNNPPNQPNNPQPNNWQVAVPVFPSFSWFCSDPDMDYLNYDIAIDPNIGMLNTTPFIRVTNLLSPSYFVDRKLASNTTYYWQVTAKDPTHSTPGPIWAFTTGMGDAFQNQPPFYPNSPNPMNQQQDAPTYVNFSWMGGDPNPVDSVQYTIYFGTDTNQMNLPQIGVMHNNTFYQYPTILSTNTWYYWYIVADDYKGGKTTGPLWMFKTGGTSNNPPWVRNVEPSDNAVNQMRNNIMFRWDGGDSNTMDTVTYEVHLGTNPNPGSIPMIGSYITNNFYQYIATLEGGITYYWYVIAQDNIGAKTQGPVWKFTTGYNTNNSPWIVYMSPYDWATNQPLNITLDWDGGDTDVGDVVDYEIFLGTNSSLTALPSVGKTYYNNTSFTYPYLLTPGTTYYWYVIARDQKGAETKGPVIRFTTGTFNTNNPPYVDSPSPMNYAYGEPIYVSFNWDGYDQDLDSINYEIHLGTYYSDNLPIVGWTYNDNTYFQYPTKLNNSTTYYWYVVAKDSRGAESKSSIWQFTTAVPANNPPWVSNPSPWDLSMNQPLYVNLSWSGGDPDGNTVKYEIHLGISNSYSLPVIDWTYDYTSYQYYTQLSPNTTYYWYIIANDYNGGTTTSPIWRFTTGNFTNNPPWVSNPYPWDWSYDQPLYINLSWVGGDPEGDSIDYEIYLGTDYNISNLPKIGNTYVNNSYFPYPNKLLASTTYYWYVIAKDSKGARTQGPLWTFTTGSFGANNPPYIPSSPAPGPYYIVPGTSTTLSWVGGDPDANPVTYKINLGHISNNTPVSDLANVSSSGTSYNVTGLLPLTTYYWQITADDGQGGITEGPIWAFTTGVF